MALALALLAAMWFGTRRAGHASHDRTAFQRPPLKQHRRTRRQIGGSVLIALIAVVVGAATVWVGLRVLDVASPPFRGGSLAAVGAANSRSPFTKSAGYTIRVGITPYCSEEKAWVRVLVVPSRTWWNAAGDLPGLTWLTIAVPDVELESPNFAYAVQLREPPKSILEVDTPLSPFPEGAKVPGPMNPSPIERADTVTDDGTALIVLGIRNWSSSKASIGADFFVDWQEPRGVGTCYVTLPDLTGDIAKTNGAGAGYLWLTDNEKLAVDDYPADVVAAHRGEIEVLTGSGSVDVGQSLPPPDQSGQLGPVWSCADARGGSGVDESIPDREASRCAALVVFEAASHTRQFNLLLVLLGTGASLAVALVVELLLRSRKRD